MSADEEKENTEHSQEGVELFVVPYHGQDIYYDEETNTYKLKKRVTGLLPVIYQRPSVMPATMESNPEDPPSAGDVNQIASCSTEEQSLNQSEQPSGDLTEWEIIDLVDEVPNNAGDSQSLGSGNEQQPVSDERQPSDHSEETCSNVYDYQSPASTDQLHSPSSELRSLVPNEQMSPSLANEQLPTYYEKCPSSTAPEEYSSNMLYYQSPSCDGQLQSDLIEFESVETSENIPSTTANYQVSRFAEQALPSSTKAQYFNPTDQQPSSSAAWMAPNSSGNVPNSSNHWQSDTTRQMLPGTAEGQSFIYTTAQPPYVVTDWQLAGCNCQQPSIPVQQPISNLGGQQGLWSGSGGIPPVSNVQTHSPQRALRSSGTLQTHYCLNGYPHSVTPCCVPGYRSPAPAEVSPVPSNCFCSQCQATSSQNPGVLKPVYYSNLPLASNQMSYSLVWQAGNTCAPVYTLQAPAQTMPQGSSLLPLQECLESLLKQLCNQQGQKKAGSSESHAPETNRDHSSSEDTYQERSSFPSSQGEELPSEDAVETENELGREENSGNNIPAAVASLQEDRQQDQQNFETPQKSKYESSQLLKSNQQQGEKGNACNMMDKKSRKKRYKHKKKQQVRNLDHETPPMGSQQKICQEEATPPRWRNWKRNRVDTNTSVKQPHTASSSDSVPVPKKRGRRLRVFHQMQDMLTITVTIKDKERPQLGCRDSTMAAESRPVVIDLDGPTPQESAGRHRRSRHLPSQVDASCRTDADVDEPQSQPGSRCSRCSSESPPSGLCYRCCCLGASRRLRRGGTASEPSARTQSLESGSQTASDEAAAELTDQNNNVPKTASDPQQDESQHKGGTPPHRQG